MSPENFSGLGEDLLAEGIGADGPGAGAGPCPQMAAAEAECAREPYF